MKQRARIAAIIALCATMAVLVAALLGACAASRLGTELASFILVNNGYINDVKVWVVHAGERERVLGSVNGHSRAIFALRSSDMADGALQLLAISYLDNQRFLSDRVPMALGQSAEFDIHPLSGSQSLWPKSGYSR